MNQQTVPSDLKIHQNYFTKKCNLTAIFCAMMHQISLQFYQCVYKVENFFWSVGIEFELLSYQQVGIKLSPHHLIVISNAFKVERKAESLLQMRSKVHLHSFMQVHLKQLSIPPLKGFPMAVIALCY